MRKIGQLSAEKSAERLHRYLAHKGIENRVDANGSQWDIWVFDESQIPQAREIYHDFSTNPEASRFDAPAVVVKAPVAPPTPQPERGQRNRNVGPFSVTLVVSVLCFWFAIVTSFGNKTEEVAQLKMASSAAAGLSEIAQGQVWRLVTPMFLHFSAIHLLFNVYIFWMLGSAIERGKGNFELLWIVLVINLVANFTQYFLAGPNFGGLSGVVYGLFGYVWMRSRLLPSDGFYMPRSLVNQMILWAILCIIISDAIPIANGAHFGGLFAGMALGALPRLWRPE